MVDITVSGKVDESGLLSLVESLARFPVAMIFIGDSDDHIQSVMDHWCEKLKPSRCCSVDFTPSNQGYALNPGLLQGATYLCVGVDRELCPDPRCRQEIIRQLRAVGIQFTVIVWVDYGSRDPLPDWSENVPVVEDFDPERDDTRTFDWNNGTVRGCPPAEGEADCLIRLRPT